MRAAAAVGEVAGGGEGETDAVAVGPGFSSENGDFWGDGDVGAAQGFPEDLLLDLQLRGVIGVLVLAASAGSEMGAPGRYSSGRWRQDLVEFGFEEAALVFGDLGGDRFAG